MEYFIALFHTNNNNNNRKRDRSFIFIICCILREASLNE
jgi:hypothetical protein